MSKVLSSYALIYIILSTNIHQYVFYDQEYARNYHLDTLDFEVDKLLYNRDIKCKFVLRRTLNQTITFIVAQYLFCTMHRLYPIEIYGMRLYVNKDEFAEHSVVFQAAIAFDALKPDNKVCIIQFLGQSRINLAKLD